MIPVAHVLVAVGGFFVAGLCSGFLVAIRLVIWEQSKRKRLQDRIDDHRAIAAINGGGLWKRRGRDN